MLDWSEKQVEGRPDVILFELYGRLDSMQAEYLYSVLKKRVPDGEERWILDLSKVDYISSMGLGMLVRVNSRLHKAGGEVKIAGVQGLVAETLRIARLDRILQLYPSVEKALDSWPAEAS